MPRSTRLALSFREQFEKAPQVIVTYLGGCYNEDGFVATSQYPSDCNVEADEIGMLVRSGQVIRRYFSVD